MEFIKYKNLKMCIFMEVCYNNLCFPHLLEQGVSAETPLPGAAGRQLVFAEELLFIPRSY